MSAQRQYLELAASCRQITVVCELNIDLFESALEAIKGWERQHPGRDVDTEEPRLMTLQSRKALTITLLVQRPVVSSTTTPLVGHRDIGAIRPLRSMVNSG